MGQFSAFDAFGIFNFSSEPSTAERVYVAMKNSNGEAFDFTQGTYAEAKLYATAMAIGTAQSTLKRARNQKFPKKAFDKLPTLERDYGCVVGPNDTLEQRQDRVAARVLLMRGAREEAITTELAALLGADLIKLRATKSADRVTYPTNPEEVGTFPKLDAGLVFGRITQPIIPKHIAFVHITQPVRYALLANGPAPLVGQKLTIEPEIDGIAEAVIVTDVAVDSEGFPTLSAAFTKPHTNGCAFTSAAPLWRSTQREVMVIVTQAAATNPETRRKIHEIMARHSKSVTRWEIVAASSATQVGPFVVGTGKVGVTAIGSSAFTF